MTDAINSSGVEAKKLLKIYKASAGSGKTYTLVQRYLDLLLSEDTQWGYKKILVATFTNKATTELRERIVKELYNISLKGRKEEEGKPKKSSLQLEEEKKRAKEVLERILLDYESLRVQTIDSFFQEIVRTFVIELENSSANAEVALDRDGAIEMSVDRLLLHQDDSVMKRLGAVLLSRVEEGDSTDMRAAIIHLAKEMLYNPLADRYQILDLDSDDIDLANRELTRKVEEAIALLQEPYDALQETLQQFSEEELALSSYKILKTLSERELSQLIEAKGGNPKKTIYHGSVKIGEDGRLAFLSKTNYKTAEKKYPRLVAEYDNLSDQILTLDKVIGEQIRVIELAKLLKENLSLLPLLKELRMEINKYQKEHMVVLIEEINELVKKVIDEASTPLIYEKVGGTIDHYMLDEFQDTNRTQWDNFKVLLEESLSHSKENFLVGDVKQSIYRWRGTDSSLLNSGVETDPELQHYTINKPLSTNWRSDEYIVRFNNLFFDNIYNFPLHTGLDGESNETFKQIYASNVCQDPKQKNKRGYVHFERLEASEEGDVIEEVIASRIEKLLLKLHDDGYSPGDIAFVVRTREDAIKVAEMLNSFAADPKNEVNRHCFAFLSDEALLVSHSNTVKLITALFQHVADPQNKQKQIYFEVACYTFGLHDQEKINQLIEIAQTGVTLFEITNELLANLEVPREEELYINSFLDLLHQFVENEPNTLLQFSYWWKRIGVNEKVTMGSDENDKIQLITLHKAKGLEFPVVIMPYVNWFISKTRQNSSLEFCDQSYLPEGFVTNPLPFYIIPEAPSEKHLDSLIGKKYREIHEANYLDNLNLLYVAFTRPKERLYLFTTETEETKNVTRIIYERFKEIEKVGEEKGEEAKWESMLVHPDKDKAEAEGKEKDKRIWTFGKELKKVEPSSSDTTPDDKVEQVQLHLNKEPRQSILKRIETETAFDSDAIQHGVKMHDVMSRVITRDDFKSAISRLQRTEEERRQLTAQFEAAFKETPQLLDWFTPKEGRSILTEQSIYLGEYDRHRRPDRLIIEGDEAIVIDYKFGENTDVPQYRAQIKAYLSLLEKMGYNAKGYLWNWEGTPQIVEVKK